MDPSEELAHDAPRFLGRLGGVYPSPSTIVSRSWHQFGALF